MKTFLLLVLLSHLLLTGINAQVTKSSYVTQYGEKVLQLSIVVPMKQSDVWELFSTERGLKKWMAPVASIQMKTGGYIKTNYDISKDANDSSSIRLDILNYLEHEMMTLKINLNNNFPKEVQAEDKNLQEILQFVDMGKGNTKIICTMVGWGKGAGWDQAYGFFEKGNDWTFREILKLFETGPKR